MRDSNAAFQYTGVDLKRNTSAQTIEIDAMIELSQAGDSFYSSYGIPSDIPSLSEMSSTESLAVSTMRSHVEEVTCHIHISNKKW